MEQFKRFYAMTQPPKRWSTAIPRHRVMNWYERGVEDPPGTPIAKMCGARLLDANMDDRDLTPDSWRRAVEMCKREPCVCRKSLR